MRKANVTITMILPLENEATLIAQIVPILTQLKTDGKIEGAVINSKELEVPYNLEI